ncbi:MAG: FG-GAP repeat protein, partial [Planctomycetota bacterium]
KLLPVDGAATDYFGSSVAIGGTTAVVGAHTDNDNGDDSGSAYLFDTATGQQTAKLLPADGAASDLFGRSATISGTTAVVGAAFDDDNGDDSGAVYLFHITTGQQIAKLLPGDGAAGDQFGWSLSISGTTAVVGASFDNDNGNDSGAAYVFSVDSGGDELPDD